MPSLYDSFIRYSMPVYRGAIRTRASAPLITGEEETGDAVPVSHPVVKYELMSDPIPDETPQEDFEIPLPPASFSFLVLSLRTQAEVQLGLLHFGEEEKPEPNLPLARHSIDLLAVLLEKTKGNLTMEEHRLLENSLTELRFRFVQVSDDVAKAAAQKA